MNISQNLERAAIFFPEKTAIIFEGRTISYKMLNTAVNRLANALRANHIQKGDCVALFLPNIPQFAICYTAVVKIGAIAVSINPMLKSEEFQYIANDSGAVIVMTVSDLLPHIPRDECPGIRHILICEGDAMGNPTLDGWIEKGSSNAVTEDMDADDYAALLYTSGTTGVPKGATLSHGNIVSNTWATIHHANYSKEDRMPLFLPAFHVFGQNFIMNATFAACATLVMFRRFVPDQVLDAVGKDKITMFFAVPTIYISLLNMDLSGFDLSTIRYEFSAASTMPREVSAEWTRRFGRPVYEGYGLTECSPFACYNHDFRHKFGSVGTPVENFEIKIMDDKDREAPLGEWGEICIKGPGVMKGYWNRPGETKKTLRNGWLHSGDIGTMDDEGYVFIVDRVKDMINIAGFKVWPAEVEQVIYRHPLVKETAVYGVPHPEKGELAKAAVVLKEGEDATGEEIIDFCREKLANYKIPSAVEIVDELPKGATGKILKRVLRDKEQDR